MAYNPGISYDTQSMGQGIQRGAQNLATGLREMQANRTMAGQALARFEATAAANPDILKFLDAGQAPSAAASAYKSLLSGGTLPVQKAAILAQFADTFTNQQKQAQETKAREMQLRQFQMQAQQQGDQMRRDELARNFAMSGAGSGILSPAMQNNPFFKQRGQALAAGTDLSAGQMLDYEAKMQPPPTKPQMIFQNQEALEKKFPSSKFDYSMVEGPDGTITVSTVSPRAPQSELPPGYEPAEDGGIRPIKGSPDDVKRQEAEAAKGKRVEQELTRANVILNSIENIIPRIDGFTAGFGGTALEKIAGTEAKDVAATIDTIKANIGFQTLQQMREASPTGGALGQIAVRELDFLQAALGNLSQSQSPAQLKKTLGKIQTHYEKWKSVISGQNPDEEAREAEVATPAGELVIKSIKLVP